jgi:LytR cell envelope-related transcriptional attenuator
MTRGKVAVWSCCAVGALLAGACATAPAGVEIRAIDSASSRIKGGSTALAEAQGLLNLGNPGLALEAFRKIQREQPSADALAGIAACYVAMGRDDLAKTNFEAALAMSPRSAELLQSVALVMDRLGLKDEADSARMQAKLALAHAASTSPPNVADAKAEEVAVASVEPPAVPQAEAVSQHSGPSVEKPVPGTVAEAVEEARRFVKERNLSSSVTVKLPPARMASAVTPPAPRLERLSPTEVALVTTATPFWAPIAVERRKTAFADSRWVPLRASSDRPNIKLFNAARVQGLAAAARNGLIQRGWRKIEIGDYADLRKTSVVLYPPGKERIGKSLARHFGIPAAPTKGGTLTVVLGRDSAAHLRG